MSNDQATNEFIRACVIQAARFLNMGKTDAGTALANVARMAAESPQATAPVRHYAPHIREALELGYGFPHALADLAHGKQEEAVAAWMWFQDATGAELDVATTATTLADAVAEMRIGGEGWRQRMRDALNRDFNRRDFGKPHLND